MKLAGALLFMILVVTTAALAKSIEILGPNRHAFLEGDAYEITWKAEGLKSVNVLVRGEKTPLGTEPRGSFVIVVAEAVPAERGSAEWRVPWIDSRVFFVKVEGYDENGEEVTQVERGYAFRPAVLAKRLKDGIYLDLYEQTNQRLYVQKDLRLTHVYLTTSSHNYKWSPLNVHPEEAHDHAGVFRVLSKTLLHWSRQFNVEMPYAMRYYGGHFIHATSKNLYDGLGGPASSGCNRLTLRDAKELYEMTPVGTRVEVIGPDG